MEGNMTGETKKEILQKLLKLEITYLEQLQKGIIPKDRPYAILAREYGCTENKESQWFFVQSNQKLLQCRLGRSFQY